MAELLKLVFSSAALAGDEGDAEAVVVLVELVTEEVSELTIWVSMTGFTRVEVTAGTAALPVDEATTRLFSCRAPRLAPDVVTASRVPDTAV